MADLRSTEEKDDVFSKAVQRLRSYAHGPSTISRNEESATTGKSVSSTANSNNRYNNHNISNNNNSDHYTNSDAANEDNGRRDDHWMPHSTGTVLLEKFSVESHITVGFSAFLSSIGM